MKLGEIIKNYRNEHQMSMDDFAKLSGMSKSYISILEKNVNPSTGKEIAPSIKSIQQAALAMRIPFDDLFKMLDSNVDIHSEDYLLSDSVLVETHISDDEKKLLQAFRLADYVDKLMVLRALHIDEDNNNK